MPHAKDILSKYLFGAFPADAFSTFGLSGVHLTRAVPTELVEVYQGTTDFVWETTENTLVHIEFQSRKEPTLYRFLVYDALLARHYRRAIQTIVLNIGSVTEAPDRLDVGSIVYAVDNLYLNRIDGEAVLETVTEHLDAHQWTPEDRVRLAFAWHLRYDKNHKQAVFDRVLHLVQQIPDAQEQNLVTALLLGLSIPQLSASQEQQLKEMLKMTNVVREIEKDAAKEATQEAMRKVAQKMLRLNIPVEQIVEVTQLTSAEIDALRSQPAR